MVTDDIREALSATRDAWQSVEDELPTGDPDRKAAALLALDNAILELEEAARIAGVPEDETS